MARMARVAHVVRVARAGVRGAVALAFALVCTASALPREVRADNPPRIRVKGTSFIDAHAARYAGKLALSGTVTDDVAQPVAHARVGLQIVSGRAGPQARSAIALS